METLIKLVFDIQKQYGVQNGLPLAEKLLMNDITKLNDEIREKIEYLKSICPELSLEEWSETIVIAELPLGEIAERYNRYAEFNPDIPCEANRLLIPKEVFMDYEKFFKKIGFSEEQMHQGLARILRKGFSVKTDWNIEQTAYALAPLGFSTEEMKQFIFDNIEMLFDSLGCAGERIYESVMELVEEYGREEAVEMLKKQPWLL